MTPQPDVFSFLSPALLQVLYLVGGIIVLCEALNKIQRTDIFARGLTWRLRFVAVLKVIAWLCLAAGAAGSLASPLFHIDPPKLRDVLVMVGFAILIVRSRFKEEPSCEPTAY